MIIYIFTNKKNILKKFIILKKIYNYYKSKKVPIQSSLKRKNLCQHKILIQSNIFKIDIFNFMAVVFCYLLKKSF